MRRDDLPNWVQYPPVVVAFFALCIAIPILVGLNEKAAAFGGGLASGLAAVIAVVVGGLINRDNDRKREKHRRDLELFAAGTELALYFERIGNSLGVARDRLVEIGNSLPGATPAPKPFMYENVQTSLMDSLIPPPERLYPYFGWFPRPVAKRCINFRVSLEIATKITKLICSDETGAISSVDAKRLGDVTTKLIDRSAKADKAVTEFLSSMNLSS